jgi:predicted RecA/RadA family phage recombinase
MPNHIRTARPSGDIRGFPCTCTESGGYTSGKILKVNDTYGVVFEDAALGEDFTLNYHVEKILLPKLAGVTMSKGQKVFHSGVYGTGVSNADIGDNIGIVLEDAQAGDTHVLADLKGDKPTAT